jgi:hypothetical protein
VVFLLDTARKLTTAESAARNSENTLSYSTYCMLFVAQQLHS